MFIKALYHNDNQHPQQYQPYKCEKKRSHIEKYYAPQKIHGKLNGVNAQRVIPFIIICNKHPCRAYAHKREKNCPHDRKKYRRGRKRRSFNN